MSLVVVVKGPEGVVLAADTRITVTRRAPDGQSREANFDNATKILTFGKQHSNVAAVAYGQAMISGRPVHSLMPEFQRRLGVERRQVVDYARELGEFLTDRWVDSGAPGVGPSPVCGRDRRRDCSRVRYTGFMYPTHLRQLNKCQVLLGWRGADNLRWFRA